MREVTVVASDVAPIGGMERVAYEICTRLVERGWAVTVIARSCALAPGPRVRHVRLRAPGRPISLAMLTSAVHGTAALARHRRGVVHVHNAVVANRVDVLTVHFCERAYRRLVGVPRNSRPTLAYRVSAALASKIDLSLETMLLSGGRARRVACVSEGVVEEVRRFHPRSASRALAIPNGVDRARFAPDAGLRHRTRAALGIPPDAATAVFVGGDWQRKNLALAIEGVARTTGWRLIVVGPGDQERFAAVAERLGAGDRVLFTGRRPDPRPYYAAADALLFVSGYEAFSLVTLEAAASGLALVVSRINGTEELVQDGVNGRFVTADPEDVAARLEELGSDRARLETMGAAARTASARYDWDRIVDDYEALFGEVQLGGSATSQRFISPPRRSGRMRRWLTMTGR